MRPNSNLEMGTRRREIRQESLRFLMQNSHRSLDTHGRTETRLSYCKQTTGMPLTRHSYEAVTARGIMKISREDVLRVAELAHLELSPRRSTPIGQLDEISATSTS